MIKSSVPSVRRLPAADCGAKFRGNSIHQEHSSFEEHAVGEVVTRKAEIAEVESVNVTPHRKKTRSTDARCCSKSAAGKVRRRSASF